MVSVVALAALALTAPTEVSQSIASASLFKNGLAVVVREISVNGSGEFVVNRMPRASLGTLWVTASEGVRIESVATTTTETSTKAELGSLDEILQASVGKKVTLIFADKQERTGVLLSATGAIVVLQETDGGTVALPKASVLGVMSEQGLVHTRPILSSNKGLRFTVQAPRGGKVYVLGLERGMTWAPGYSVELLDDKRLRLTAKATLLNDLDDLNQVEVRFITGFPNVPFATVLDPLTSGQSVDEFIAMLGRLGVESGAPAGRAGEAMMRQAPASMADQSMGMEPTGAGGFQAEDLFFYRQPNVRLQKGERAYYVLFRAEAPYESIYNWDLPFGAISGTPVDFRPVPTPIPASEFWHTLRFRNTSGQPLTTAAATTFKNGEIIGQDMLRYTPTGSDTTLRVTRAMDIQGEESEEEVSRDRAALKLPNNVVYDLVTLKGTVLVRNRKNERVKLTMSRELPGEFVSSEGVKPKVTTTTRGLRQINPYSRLAWETELAAGQEVTLTYSYRVYVRADGR